MFSFQQRRRTEQQMPVSLHFAARLFNKTSIDKNLPSVPDTQKGSSFDYCCPERSYTDRQQQNPFTYNVFSFLRVSILQHQSYRDIVPHHMSQIHQGERIARLSIRDAVGLPIICSFFGSQRIFRPRVIAMLPRCAAVTERWPTSIGAIVCARVLTQSRKSRR